MTEESLWQKAARLKRLDLDRKLNLALGTSSIEPFERFKHISAYLEANLSAQEYSLTEIPLELLTKQLQEGLVTAKSAIQAFARRAALTHHATNCLLDLLIEEASERASFLDAEIRRTGKPVGSLHGVPISVKDQFRVCGAETTLGYVGWLGRKETSATASLAVKILEKEGAIVFAKTNVPASLMAMETNNNITGYTWNPYNIKLSSAGSSGGEAALLAARGSLLGLGSDYASSIRLPCSMQALCGLKPSHGRLPYMGVANSMEGSTLVKSVIGPMAHSVRDLTMLTKTIIAGKPWKQDPEIIELPWRDDKAEHIRCRAKGQESGLVFGILVDDGVVKPHPPILRAMRMAVSAIQRNGHRVVTWDPPSHAIAFNIMYRAFTADGGNDIFAAHALSEEPLVPQLSGIYGHNPGHLQPMILNEYWETQRNKLDYQTRYLRYWNEQNPDVDFVLLPATAATGFLPNTALYPGYTAIANILDFTAAVIPVTTADKTTDAPASIDTRSDFEKNVCDQYDPVLFHGLPVGIQVMGQRLDEEGVLAGAEEVRRCLENMKE